MSESKELTDVTSVIDECVGSNCNDAAYRFGGLIDELRISDTVRYTENFTPQTTPFEPDDNTKLLLHFDENGDDPRNSGIAFDASGNGNHGTITGAKYVSGLIGSDSSSTDTGYIDSQSYASHQGVFIEEGTTNLVTNPSFDHDTFDTNWSTNYFNYATASATFTQNMAKRNGGGPFAAGTLVQGDWNATEKKDEVYFVPSLISGYFFNLFDSYQGSVVFWVTPEWNGDDGKNHPLIGATTARILIWKDTDNKLNMQHGGTKLNIDISDWNAGNTYLVVFRWDTKNTLDGTNYFSISVGNNHNFGSSSNGGTAGTSGAIGIGSKAGSSSLTNGDALIEGLTIYRRPLWDGEYGIDVGNGDEIEQIYNSEAGQDPTLITGSWDVVFCLPTNASTGTLSTGTGEAWSHPHADNVLYTDTDNTGGFMLDGTYTDDGWADEGTPSNVTGTTAPEKIYSGGYQVTSDAADEGIKYILTSLTAGQDYVVRALAHSDGTSIPKIQIWDATNGQEITQMTGTTGTGRTAPEVFLFTFELPTVARYNPVDDDEEYDWVDSDTSSIEVRLLNTESSGTVYWHQVELLGNLVDDPSMEGPFLGTPLLPSSWSTPDLDDGDISEGAVTHSGSQSIQFNTSAVWAEYMYQTRSLTNGDFYNYGVWLRGDGTSHIRAYGTQNLAYQTSSSTILANLSGSTADSWNKIVAVGRAISTTGRVGLAGWSSAVANRYADDYWLFQLNDVSLNVTSATQENSTEDSGLRVDGADELTQTISNWNEATGSAKFKFTPRHSYADAADFGVGNPVIAHFYYDSTNYIKIHYHDSDTLRVVGMFNEVEVDADWETPTLNSGTTYTAELSYAQGGDLRLTIDDSLVAISDMTVDQSFATDSTPATVYFGTDNGGAGSNPYDLTISSFVSIGSSENTTSPYYKFGSKSAQIVTYDSNDEYTIPATVTTAGSHTLSAYVYNGNSGSIGGTIDSSVAELATSSAALTTTYTDEGGGWWRLTASPTLNVGTYNVGVQAKAGQTIYVDGVQLEQKSYATTYTDGSLGTGYSWSGTAHESGSTRTETKLRYNSSNVTPSAGAISLWVKGTDNYNIWTTTNHWLVSTGGSWNSPGVHVDFTGSSLRLRVFDDESTASTATFSSSGLSQTGWHHVVGVWAENNVNVYIDNTEGTPDASATMPTSISNASLDVGWHNSTSWLPLTATFSDLRIYDAALTADQVSDLYYQGLSTHQSGDESDDRYESGAQTYTSPVIDLSANGQWGGTPIEFTQYLGGGTIDYYTRSSADNLTWSDWEAVSGTTIASDPRQYFQWKADLTANADQNDSPVVTGMVVSYVEDSTAPTNPDETALGWSTAATDSADLTSGSWYNYSLPKFTWDAGVDEEVGGQSASGIDGYHVLLTTTSDATPSDETGDDCYAWLEESDREFIVGTDAASCTLSNGTYYLRVQTKDNSGNIADAATLFTYKYDGSNPNAPASISTSNIGYQAENSFTFYWPIATDNGPSGVSGYEYKTGESGAEWTYTASTTVTDISAYQEGQNTFYVRTLDNAGNYSGSTSNDVQTTAFYYNSTAPTAPTNLVISPTTTEDSPSDSNVFDVTWDEPASYSGSIAKYYYCVNCTPSADTMTEASAAEIVNEALEDKALATQQGKNTFYLVAEDNNLNTTTGLGNRNFDAYASVDFYASTTAPGAPTNLTISDASDRDNSKWRLGLAWDAAGTGGTAAEYHVYRSIDNTSFSKIGETTSTAYTDAGLTQSTTYYYKVYAIDDAGSTSLASNTVNDAPEGRYSDAPTIGGTPTVSAGASTATISWTTSRTAYGSVDYGKTTSYGSTSSEASASASHSVALSGLSSGTTYHYRVQALDDSSLVGYERSDAYSTDYTFTTLSSPEISEVTVEEVGLDSAIITWTTQTVLSTSIEYGTTTEYGSTQTISTTAGSNTHTARITGLDHSTVYHFKVTAVTSDSIDIESDDYTFETITFPEVTAYLLKTDQNAGGTTIALAWSTNVPTTSVVSYQAATVDATEFSNSNFQFSNTLEDLQGLTQAQLATLPLVVQSESQQQAKDELVTTHVMRLGSLKDGSVYIFTLKGRDQYGNEAVSDPIRYVTGQDTRPPVIMNINTEAQITGSGGSATSQILVSWETDEPATSQVFFGQGTGTEYPSSTPEDTNLTTQHMVVIRDLQPTSSYHLKISSKDEAANEAKSQDLIAVTPTSQESALDVVLKNLEDVFGFLKI